MPTATKQKPIAPVEATSAVFALSAWTIKRQGDKFFISPTVYFDDKSAWRGPYRSLRDATTAIARKLEAEFTERNNRITTFRTKAKR